MHKKVTGITACIYCLGISMSLGTPDAAHAQSLKRSREKVAACATLGITSFRIEHKLGQPSSVSSDRDNLVLRYEWRDAGTNAARGVGVFMFNQGHKLVKYTLYAEDKDGKFHQLDHKGED